MNADAVRSRATALLGKVERGLQLADHAGDQIGEVATRAHDTLTREINARAPKLDPATADPDELLRFQRMIAQKRLATQVRALAHESRKSRR